MLPFYDRVIGTEAGSTGTIRPADAAIVERAAAGDARVTGADLELNELVDLACDNYHPGVETQALMAENTIAFLRAELGW